MATFLWNALINGVLATAVLYSAYLVAAATMLNLAHGSICEWRTRLGMLALRLPKDKVEITEELAVIKAPLSDDILTDLRAFLSNHGLVDRAERRLNLVRARGRLLLLALIVGFAIGIGLSSPALFGSQSPTVTYPVLAASIGAFGAAAVVLMFNFPHGLDWGRLKDATEGLGAG